MTFELDAETRPLCTGAESNLRDRILGETKKNSFIALPGKGGHSGLMPSKLCVPTQGGFGEEFYNSISRAGLLRRIRVCVGPAFLYLASGGLLMSFCGSRGYPTLTFSLE